MAVWFSKTAYWIPTVAAGAAVYAADSYAIPLGLGYGAYKAARYIDRRYPSERDMASYFGMDLDTPGRSFHAGSGASSKRSRAPPAKRPRRNQVVARTGSHFKGRFKGKKQRAAPVAKYTRSGIITHRENAELLTAGEVLYVGAGSFSHDEILHQACIALLRRLFRTAGPWQQQFLDVDEAIGSNATSNVGWDFKFRRCSDNATQLIATAGAGPTAPFTNWFVAGTTLTNAALELACFVRTYWVGNDNGPHELFEVGMTSRITLTNQIIIYKKVELEHWKFNVFSNLVMKLQNVTPADDGLVLQDTDITCNPLQGTLFRFNGITPCVKDYMTTTTPAPGNWGQNLCELRSDRSQLIVPLNNPPTDGWNTVPSKTQFTNCTSAISIRLEPGDIKFTTIGFKYRGTIHNLLKGMYGSAEAATVAFHKSRIQNFGTSFVFALEKTMRTGTSGVKCNMQFDVTTGATVKPGGVMHVNHEVSIAAAPPVIPSIP